MTSYFATALLLASLLGAQCNDSVLDLFPEFQEAVDKLAQVANNLAHLKTRVDDIQPSVSQLQVSVDLQECPYGQKRWQGSCYYFGLGKVTWDQARARCISVGGHLVKIDNAVENRMLVDEANNIGMTSDIWIGANDYSNEGIWVWDSDNSPVNYTNWSPGNPNNYRNQDYARLYINTPYTWDDIQASYKFHYICEKEL